MKIDCSHDKPVCRVAPKPDHSPNPSPDPEVKGIPNEWPEQLLREGVVDALIVEADAP